MSIGVTELLSRLVQIPSVNPVFSAEGEGGEAQLTDFLQSLLEDLGCRWLRQTVHPRRDNLVAVLPGNEPGVMLWEVHQDTVGIEGMRIDPFAGHEKDGRIWGRGACDVKGGMAAMLAAAARVGADSSRKRSTLLLGFTVNEECGFSGASALSNLWSQEENVEVDPETVTGPLSLAELRQLRPQRAIVAEPTQLDIVVAHRGVVRWRCHARGRAAHSSQPERGSNAIYAMADVARAIETYHLHQLSSRAAHPRCGRPTVCVSTIHGGTGVNIVPDHAVIDIDRRLIPGETPQEAYEALVAYVADHTTRTGVAIEHETPWIETFGLDDDNNQAWAEQIAAVAHSLGLSSELIGVPFGTDAPTIVADDIATVVFGPGSIDQAHTDDEWLAVDQLKQATEILYRLAVRAMPQNR